LPIKGEEQSNPKVAETYDALAQTIEDIAERQTRPWMPGEKPVGVS
jgi:hypothetical protein